MSNNQFFGILVMFLIGVFFNGYLEIKICNMLDEIDAKLTRIEDKLKKRAKEEDWWKGED